MLKLADVERAIQAVGLSLRGALRLDHEERSGALVHARALVLVGMTGSRNWSAFTASAEAADGASDPLDRWSRRVIDRVALSFSAHAVYPFGGPPYWPFPSWALRTGMVWASPLGILIDREFGLWHSYRGALAFPEAFELAPVEAAASPCASCVGRPCLSACPVAAFTGQGYDVARCVAHLRGPSGGECRDGGCLARLACPVGAGHAYDAARMRFHMRAFLGQRAVSP